MKKDNILKFDPDFLNKKDKKLTDSEEELLNGFLNDIDSQFQKSHEKAMNAMDESAFNDMNEAFFSDPASEEMAVFLADENIQKLMQDPDFDLSRPEYYNSDLLSPQTFLLNLLTFWKAFKKEPAQFIEDFFESQEKITVSLDEAIDFYGRFIIEFDPDQSFDFIEKSHIQRILWKYFSNLEKSVFSVKSTKKMLDQIRRRLDFDEEDLSDFLTFMFNVKLAFAPTGKLSLKSPFGGSDQIQIIKDDHIILQPFNHFHFDPTVRTVKVVAADHSLFELLSRTEYYSDKKLNNYITDQRLEKLILESQKRLRIYLNKANVKSISQKISDALGHFLRFIYFENRPLTIENVKPKHIKKYFDKDIFKNNEMSPYELTYMAPAVFFFYVYLSAQGYLRIPEKIIQTVLVCERGLIDALRDELDV